MPLSPSITFIKRPSSCFSYSATFIITFIFTSSSYLFSYLITFCRYNQNASLILHPFTFFYHHETWNLYFLFLIFLHPFSYHHPSSLIFHPNYDILKDPNTLYFLILSSHSSYDQIMCQASELSMLFRLLLNYYLSL